MTHPDDSADWRPSASLEALKSRAMQLTYVRGFFADRGVLEVETPVLARCGVTEPHLDNIGATLVPPPGWAGGDGWLQTSPEYHMKRLLAAGSGPVFQVARAFRDGEWGGRHNPEFSLLEWYRPGFDDARLMTEVAELVCGWLDVPEPRRLSYRDSFMHYVGLDPFTAPLVGLADRCERWVGRSLANELGRDDCLDVLMSHEVEVALRTEPPTFICHYPGSQASLARTSVEDGVTIAHRFELYVQGLELCNGYWELTDATEQQRRFDDDNRRREQLGKPVMATDQRLLAALASGLPSCAGVALGLDRLLMLKLGKTRIDDVLAFPVGRA